MKDFFQLISPPVERGEFPPVIEKGVGMNKHIDLTIEPADGSVYSIHTEGRIGCDACLLLTIEPNGRERVAVTHYDPTRVSDHTALIRRVTTEHPQGRRYAVLLTRGKEDDGWRQQISQALIEFVGDESIDVVAMPDLGPEEAKQLSRPLNILKYQLSFVRGYSGDMKINTVRIEGSDYQRIIKI